jgi:hypothetical protein
MGSVESGDRFQFDEHAVANNQVDSLPGDLEPAIMNRDRALAFEREPTDA